MMQVWADYLDELRAYGKRERSEVKLGFGDWKALISCSNAKLSRFGSNM
jgi:hypothetical protein